MRKLILNLTNIVLIFLFSLSFNVYSEYTVKAESEYLRVINHETPFYSDLSQSEPLFYLPYTYYVKVLETGVNFTHVECYGTGNTLALDGFVPTQMLYKDELLITSPYLEKKITTISTAVLYSDVSLTNPIQYLFASRELNYYGETHSLDGEILFYVSYNNKLGYVKESQIYPFVIDNHPNELTFLSPPTQPEENIQTENNSSVALTTIRIVVISFLILAGAIALYAQNKNKGGECNYSGYYDENEYE